MYRADVIAALLRLHTGCVVVLVYRHRRPSWWRGSTARPGRSRRDVAERIGRADAGLAELAPDVTIQNVGTPAMGAEMLLRVLCGS